VDALPPGEPLPSTSHCRREAYRVNLPERAVTERAVFDLRLWVEGTDRFEVWERVTELQRLASLFAPAGVDVRYVQLRPNRSRRFEATMEPAKRKRAP
jgi:hypothetical protein